MAFELPTVEDTLKGSITKDGLLVNGETIPFTEIEEFVCLDDEVTVRFKEETQREELVFEIEEKCQHLLLEIETFIRTHMMQTRVAVWDEAREVVLNAPRVDVRKIRKAAKNAFKFGA